MKRLLVLGAGTAGTMVVNKLRPMLSRTEWEITVEEEVDQGTTKTLTFQAPPAGTYQIISAIEGHFDGSMEGTLTSVG